MEPTDMQLAGEPEDSYEVTIEEAVLFAVDTAGLPEYLLTTKPVIGFAS